MRYVLNPVENVCGKAGSIIVLIALMASCVSDVEKRRDLQQEWGALAVLAERCLPGCDVACTPTAYEIREFNRLVVRYNQLQPPIMLWPIPESAECQARVAYSSQVRYALVSLAMGDSWEQDRIAVDVQSGELLGAYFGAIANACRETASAGDGPGYSLSQVDLQLAYWSMILYQFGDFAPVVPVVADGTPTAIDVECVARTAQRIACSQGSAHQVERLSVALDEFASALIDDDGRCEGLWAYSYYKSLIGAYDSLAGETTEILPASERVDQQVLAVWSLMDELRPRDQAVE